jgi:hypothetical protein
MIVDRRDFVTLTLSAAAATAVVAGPRGTPVGAGQGGAAAGRGQADRTAMAGPAARATSDWRDREDSGPQFPELRAADLGHVEAVAPARSQGHPRVS